MPQAHEHQEGAAVWASGCLSLERHSRFLKKNRTSALIVPQSPPETQQPVAPAPCHSNDRCHNSIRYTVTPESARGWTASLGGKWLELLKEIAPRVARVAMLFTSTAPYAEFYVNPFKAAAASLGVEAITAPVHDMPELESVVARLAREPNSGLVVIPDSFLSLHRVEITSLAARYRLPAVYADRQFAELGGLLSYGLDQFDNFRRAAAYVDRILKGEKSADLPVQAPTKYDLVINMKTAKALGIEIPSTLLARADEIIE